ncbi:MAG TPA: diacylglycerol kinase family protein [Chthoniobacterales bacterium]|nr:diacylglycerol kinase family protein [Chthoniobacterales bacterium]
MSAQLLAEFALARGTQGRANPTAQRLKPKVPITTEGSRDSITMTVILNVGAGTGSSSADEAWSQIASFFEATGVNAHVVTVKNRDKMGATIRNALETAESTIVAAGGDGTVSAIAAQLAGTRKRMGVLPLGTLNHFAKDLGIPLELEEAIRTVVNGHTRAVDVAEVNGRVFINNSSLGLYPRIVMHREAQEEQLKRGKWPAFAWATVLAFRRFPFLHLRVCVEDRELDRKTAFVFVGNNEYHMAGFRIGGRTHLDRGKLGLYLTHRTGRFGLFRLALHALVGRLNQANDFDAFYVEEASIESRRKHLLLAIDGEVARMEPPLHYRSRPGALRVIVPTDH